MRALLVHLLAARVALWHSIAPQAIYFPVLAGQSEDEMERPYTSWLFGRNTSQGRLQIQVDPVSVYTLIQTLSAGVGAARAF